MRKKLVYIRVLVVLNVVLNLVQTSLLSILRNPNLQVTRASVLATVRMSRKFKQRARCASHAASVMADAIREWAGSIVNGSSSSCHRQKLASTGRLIPNGIFALLYLATGELVVHISAPAVNKSVCFACNANSLSVPGDSTGYVSLIYSSTCTNIDI